MNQGRTSLELWQLHATEIAAAVIERRVSCTEVITSHINRIKSINNSVNAVTVILEEESLAMAHEMDKKISKNEAVGPLCGVPITVKENIDLAGTATSAGLPFLRDAVPVLNSPHINQMLQSGAIPIARSNCSEMGMRPHTDNPLWGQTLNPYDPSLTPGGSSGGDAVAVATGMVPLGMGNDYGGSLRIPAQFCGVTSLKPSFGRVASHMSLMVEEPAISMQLFLSQGPMARSIGDLRESFYHMNGPDARDPHWVPAPLKYKGNTDKPRIALVIDPIGTGIDPLPESELREAAAVLEDAGYIVEEAIPPSIEEAWRTWLQLTSAELRVLLSQDVSQVFSTNLLTFLKYWTETIPEADSLAYMYGLAARNRIAREWNLFFQKYPVILGPASPLATPLADFDIQSREKANEFIKSCYLLMTINCLGLPGLVMPVKADRKYPTAVQIIAGRFNEELCFEIAEVLENQRNSLMPIDPRP